MPNIIRDFEPEGFYHIYNRGFNQQPLFLESADYERFVRKVAEYQQKFTTIKIHAYCLLPNHFHFLLQDIPAEDSRSTSISNFMKGVQLSHAMYFTKKYGDSVKKGLKMPVYEGRFCSKALFDETYLEAVKNYIDANAWRHGLVGAPSDWPYSSYHWLSRSTLGTKCNWLQQLNDDTCSDFDTELEY